jgi:serine/threonine-protein kinase
VNAPNDTIAESSRRDSAAFDATVRGAHDAVDALFATGPGGVPDRASFDGGRASARVVTVLPRLDASGGAPRLVIEPTARYEVARRLGEGAAGAVDLVHDRDIQRHVAVKRLKHPGDDAAYRAALLRFVDEIRLVGSLEHPNIVPIHDVGIDESGNYYFVMKFVDGEPLDTIIGKLMAGDRQTHEKYTFSYRMRVFDEVLKAVEFAHSKGIIHRDLKPANIIVGPHGEVMVADWGIAKCVRTCAAATDAPAAAALADTLVGTDAGDESGHGSERMYKTHGAMVVGTPAYMSPEQALGRVDELDERSDIYSLCALAYELMALEPYLPAKKTMQELLVAVVAEEPKMPFLVTSPHQSRMPAEYNYFVMQGLAKNPDERFQSVTAMRARLRRIDEGDIPIQCPSTFMKHNIHGVLHFLDHHPFFGLLTFPLGVAALVAAGAALATYGPW